MKFTNGVNLNLNFSEILKKIINKNEFFKLII